MAEPPTIQYRGQQLTLLGRPARVGEAAPDFSALDSDLRPTRLSEYRGQVVLVSSVVALATPVCDVQTKRLEGEAADLGAQLLTISMDLPAVLRSYVEECGLRRMRVLTDIKWREFGLGYGVLIKEMGVLARGVFVVDGAGTLAYKQVVQEMTELPDLGRVLDEVRRLKK